MTEIRGATRKNSTRICETASASRVRHAGGGRSVGWAGEGGDAKCAYGASEFFLARLKRGNEEKSSPRERKRDRERKEEKRTHISRADHVPRTSDAIKWDARVRPALRNAHGENSEGRDRGKERDTAMESQRRLNVSHALDIE